MDFIYNTLTIFILFTMPSLENNFPGNSSSNTGVSAVDAATENVARANAVLFKDIAQVVSPSLMKDSGMKRAVAEQAMQSRVIDMPVPPQLMKTAKLNLTSNGALLISLNDGKQLFNHPVTKTERNQLNNIMNNPNLSDDKKFDRLQNMISGISMSVKLSNNFDQMYQQTQSISESMHR